LFFVLSAHRREAGMRILAKSATDSDASRPPILIEVGHLFWWKPAGWIGRCWWLSGAIWRFRRQGCLTCRLRAGRVVSR